MLTSEYQRFSVSSVDLLTKAHEETVVSWVRNGTTYSDILYLDGDKNNVYNKNIVCSEEQALSLASMHPIIEDTTKHAPAGIAFDKSGALFYLNTADGTINYMSNEKNAPVAMPCIGGIGSDLCKFIPAFSSDDAFVNLFPGKKDNAQIKTQGTSKGNVCSIAPGKKMIAVSDPGNHRIQCFYRHSLQLGYVIDSDTLRSMGIAVNGNDFTPWDCVFDSCGNLYVIDVNPPKESGIFSRLLFISRRGHNAEDIGNNELKHPVSLFLDSSDMLYVLDRNRQVVLTHKFGISSSWQEILSLKDIDQKKVDTKEADKKKVDQKNIVFLGLAVDKNKCIYVGDYPDSGESRFYIWNSEGTYAGNIINKYGNCRRIIAGPQNSLFAECENSGVIQLNGNNGFVRDGEIYTGIFDSLYPDTQWHRITIDAKMGKDCSLGIEYFAWNPDPEQTSVTRDIIPQWLPLCRVLGSDQVQPDSLLNNVKSRFIVFKFKLSGNEESSPLIKKIQITFPYTSYLRYLPAIYQADLIGRDITERFLSIFEAFNMEIEEQIATVTRLLDPHSTSTEFLPWLGSWLGILQDENWLESQFRELISQSYMLFKIRGTLECLIKILSIYTGGSITIIEHYQYRRPMVLGADVYIGVNSIVGRKFNRPLIVEESSTIGDFLLIEEEEPPETPFLADAYDFTIVINNGNLQKKQIDCIRRIIEHEKPAHTRYHLHLSGWELPRIGTAMLGIDTKLIHAHEPMKIGTSSSVLGNSTKAGTRYPVGGVYGSNSTIGIDTYLH